MSFTHAIILLESISIYNPKKMFMGFHLGILLFMGYVLYLLLIVFDVEGAKFVLLVVPLTNLLVCRHVV